jgi:hypothetical protein
MPSARPRGMIVALWIGSEAGSCIAIDRVPGLVIGGHASSRPRSSASSLRSAPIMTLSLASSNSLIATRRLPRRAASKAASLTRLARSAPRHARRAARDGARIDVGRQRHLLHMDLEDLHAALDVRARHHDLAVEAARAQQCGIEHVGPVGRRDDDDAFVRLEAVHLDQQLVERLLALVILVAQARAARTADRVDLVDEDDARRRLLGLFEHVAHAAGADADEHLDESPNPKW